jgi:hypothetical protein
MFDMFSDPNQVPFSAVPGYHPALGHWIVQFTIGITPFWQVDFKDMTSRELDFEDRFEMRKIALEMFAEELKRRLFNNAN